MARPNSRAVQSRRVVITGLGALTPLGSTHNALWDGLLAGRSGIAAIEGIDVSDMPTRFGGEVRGFDPTEFMDKRDARRADRFTQMALATVAEALLDANLDPGPESETMGVMAGTGIGGIGTLTDQHQVLVERGPSRVSPFFVPMMIANMAAGQIAIRYGLKGPNATIVTACASSANAVGEAFRLVQRGDAEVMLAVGTEAMMTRLAVAGFCAMRALSTRNEDPSHASRPFDRDRDGFVLGEGAGTLVLESLEHAEARGARIYAELLGYGMAADAYHMVEPQPDGEGGTRSMGRALHDAGVDPTQVDYINAHGTSTPKGDIGETLAIKRVFGPHAYKLAVSSTKSMTGHLLGAAGVVETLITALALHHGVLPPTINLEHADPECDLDYVPNTARVQAIRVAVTNSFGFGGQNVSLVLGRVEEP